MPTYSEVKALIRDYSIQAVRAYSRSIGKLNIDHFEDAFEGEFSYQSDIDDYLVELFMDGMDVPDRLLGYLDEERIARDMGFDFTVEDYGDKVYLFRHC